MPISGHANKTKGGRVIVWTALPKLLDIYLRKRAEDEMSTKAAILRNLVKEAADKSETPV